MPEIPSISYIRIGEVDHPIDAVTLNGQTLPDDSKYLPTVSNTEDGQMLGVDTGEWSLFDPADMYEDINGLPVGGDISGDSDSDTGDSDSDSDEPVHDYSLDYLTFEILGNGTIGWKNNGTGSAKTIQYSINDGTWTSITAGSDTINVSQGDIIRFKGTNNAYAIDNSNFSGFGNIGTATFNVSGNIMSLIYGDNFANQTTLPTSHTFQSLFDHSNIVNAENLILPATTLTGHCYRAMFANCSLLRTAPQLPATTMADSCYRFMFQGCVLMTTAPNLPATTLITNCYYGMFSGTSSLNYIRCLATNPSSTYTSSWTSGVATSGTFVKDINAQWDTNTADGIPRGWTTIDEGTQIVAAPTIHCVNNIITFGCDTPNATIYYRLGGSGQYLIYDNPIEILEDTLVEVYASKNGSDSTVTSQTCIYVEPEIPGDSDSESEEGEHNYTYDYLTLDIITGGNLLWKANGTNATKTIQYSINDGEWTSITSTTSGVTIPVSAGDSVRFKGTNTRYCEQNKANYSGFEAGSATFNISGNILSLIYGDNFIGQDIVNTWAFTQFFKNSKPVSAENMILLAPSVPNSGYRAMFSKCSTLLVAPKELPATTLGQNAYYYMFEDCAFTNAPVLPAASRSSACYQYMFTNCNNLNYIKCLDTNPQSGYYTGWTTNVAAVGTFVKADNVSWTTGVNGIPTTWVQVNQSDEGSGQGGQDEPEEYDGSDAPVLLGWKYAGNDITLPYSVNAINGHTNSYSKGTYVFTSKIALDELNPTYLWFNQASQSAEIYIDNSKVTTHWGGYNSFCVDITNYVHTGINNLMVALNNTTRNTLAPCSGDFNFNATLGEVRLLSSPVVPDPSFGYDGFHISANVTDASAALTISTSVPNTATVVLTIDDGTYHYTDTATGTGAITFTHTITNPHLWHGRTDPHLYNITLEFYHDNTLYHTFTRPYGLRYFSYVYNDANVIPNQTYTGFLLNGQPYYLRGVCMHQDIEGKANALSYQDIQNDFNIINELNCNFIRTAHYPHPKEFYDLCDQYGVIVQTEVPWVNKAQSSMPADYYTHLEGQFRDMVNEHYNHPSILFWGLANEISTDDASFAQTKINGFVTIIKNIDPSRWVGYVVSHSYPNGLGTFNYPNVDWIGQNLYVGWYLDKTSNNPSSRLNTCLNNANNRSTPMAYSEYGCGGNILCHSDDPLTTTTTGNNPRHDIEFQMWLHEGHIQCIKNYPQLLFSAQWVLFDFAVSTRNEGYITCLDGVNEGPNDDTNRYLNDKGLVKRDHITKKDTFYLYKAWWNQTDIFIHICQKNYQKLSDRVFKCYTNDVGPYKIYVNGTLMETIQTDTTNYIVEFTQDTYQTGDVIRVESANAYDTFQLVFS